MPNTLCGAQRVWWLPPTWLGIPLNATLHTVFDVLHTSNGYVYTRQEVTYETRAFTKML